MYLTLENGASSTVCSNSNNASYKPISNSNHWWREKIAFLRGFCLSVGVKPCYLDDVVQEVCLKLSKVSVPVNEKYWLKTLVRNVICDFHRKENRLKVIADSSYIFVDRVVSVHEDVELEFVAPTKDELELDFQAALYAEIDRLGEHQREAMALFALGFDYQKIADMTGVSIGTVRSRLFYGKRKLKKKLESFR